MPKSCISLVFFCVLSRSICFGLNKDKWTLDTIRSLLYKKECNVAKERVIFSANLASHYVTKNNDRLVFSQVITNEGNGYNPSTGIFTCQVPGLYQFSWILHQTTGPRGFNLQLMHNNGVAFTMYLSLENGNLSGTTYLRLKSGDQVWLKAVQAGFVSFGAVVQNSALYWVPEKILADVEAHKDVAQQIIDLAVNGNAQNQSYNRLAEFVDTYGSRYTGTENLENAIDYMLKKLKEDGLENVHGEEVMVPKWVRGNESLVMTSPRYHPMALLSLGSSVGTPIEGITADVLVVNSFQELKQKAKQAAGKIVVFNEKYVSYSETVAYRSNGAVETAKVGGLASLIRSVTPFSINSPHTGHQSYSPNITKVPTACITIEDAEMMYRMQERGQKITVTLKMEAKNYPQVKSRNTVAEIKGYKYPEQVVLVSGHLDSWDVGQGAMDDGGGAFISWQALSLVKQLGLRPKRTLRVVMWTAEELGGVGAYQYYDAHKKDVKNLDLVMESDLGTFSPVAIQFTGNDKAKSIIKEVIKSLQTINVGYEDRADGTDIDPWMEAGVPGASLHTKDEKYFYFHHSNGDTMTVQDPVSMNLCSAAWAVVAYTVADLEEMLPRDQR